MTLLTGAIRFALRANDIARRARENAGESFDAVPVVKLFNPVGAATWLLTDLDEDGDTLFGLADLGFGCPELGYVSLSEIRSVRLPLGLKIERDLTFQTSEPLSVWADCSRRFGSIIAAEAELARAARVPSRGDGLPEVPSG